MDTTTTNTNTNTKLAGVLASYYAAVNAHDIERVLTLFADDALVKDEAEEHRGRDAIRAWMQTTTRKYGPINAEPAAAATTKSGVTVVTCTVSGDFKGSPVTLRYKFEVEGESITHLEIV